MSGFFNLNISSFSTTRLAADFKKISQSTQVRIEVLALNIGLVFRGCHLKVVREVSAWHTADCLSISKQWSIKDVRSVQTHWKVNATRTGMKWNTDTYMRCQVVLFVSRNVGMIIWPVVPFSQHPLRHTVSSNLLNLSQRWCLMPFTYYTM